MPGQGSRVDAQGRVADHQRRVRDPQHRVQVGSVGNGFGRHPVPVFQDHPHQFHARARTGVQRQGADLCRRAGGDQQNAAHRAVTGDARAGDDLQILPGQFERGHDADVGGAGSQLVGAPGRGAEFQVEPTARGSVEHAPDQRRGIQVADGGHAGPLLISCGSTLSLSNVSRDSGDRAFPRLPSVSGVTAPLPSTVVPYGAFDILNEVRSRVVPPWNLPCYLRTLSLYPLFWSAPLPDLRRSP